MKLLFVHDTKFKVDNKNNYYTSGSYNMHTWNRYLEICDELTVLARKEPYIYDKEYAEKKYNFFDKERILFIELPDLFSNYKSFFSRKKRIEKKCIIKNSVLNNDAIIVRLPSSAGNIAIKYAKKYNKPYLVEVVGCSWDALWNYNIKGKILAPIKCLQQKYSIRKALFVIYVTSKFLQKRYPTIGETVSCSDVVLKEIYPNIMEKRINKINNMNMASKIIIGTIGGIDVKYKGQESVIKALGKLKKQGITNFEYQLVGGGDSNYLYSIAQKYNVSQQVKFVGSLPHEKVLSWLDSIDIYIQPSKSEGLPRALIEAMSRGLPAIGSNVGGIPELLEENYIFNYSKKHISEICKILLKLKKEDLIEQAQRNFEVSKQYQWNLIEKRRKEFFDKFKIYVNKTLT